MDTDRDDGATAATSPSFLPTRDLPPLRPLPPTELIRDCLSNLAQAIGLGQERSVRLPLEGVREGEQCQTLHLSTRDGDNEDTDNTHSPAASDTIESRFAQTWLTRIISSSSLSEVSGLQDKAGEVLAALCGNPASVPERTRFHFGPVEVLIQDSPITSDALGNRTWGAAPLLSRHLLSKYSSPLRETEGLRLPTRVLELGAGTGLVGLALAALARSRGTSMQVDLTDYHPHVLDNLRTNALLNETEWASTSGEGQAALSISRLDWQEVHDSSSSVEHPPARKAYSSTAQTLPSIPIASSSPLPPSSSFPNLPPSNQYDLLIACDCVYDPLHPRWIRSVAHRHLAAPGGKLYLVSPLRRTHTHEVQALYHAFPRQARLQDEPAHQQKAVAVADGDGEFKGRRRHLQIVWERDQVGYDNFGPKGGLDGGGSGGGGGDAERRKGLRTTYRMWEIGWACL